MSVGERVSECGRESECGRVSECGRDRVSE